MSKNKMPYQVENHFIRISKLYISDPYKMGGLCINIDNIGYHYFNVVDDETLDLMDFLNDEIQQSIRCMNEDDERETGVYLRDEAGCIFSLTAQEYKSWYALFLMEYAKTDFYAKEN